LHERYQFSISHNQIYFTVASAKFGRLRVPYNEVGTTIFEDFFKAAIHNVLQRYFLLKTERKIGEKVGIMGKTTKNTRF